MPYSVADQLAADKEYNALPKDDILRRFMDNYHVERVKLDACLK